MWQNDVVVHMLDTTRRCTTFVSTSICNVCRALYATSKIHFSSVFLLLLLFYSFAGRWNREEANKWTACIRHYFHSDISIWCSEYSSRQRCDGRSMSSRSSNLCTKLYMCNVHTIIHSFFFRSINFVFLHIINGHILCKDALFSRIVLVLSGLYLSLLRSLPL